MSEHEVYEKPEIIVKHQVFVKGADNEEIAISDVPAYYHHPSSNLTFPIRVYDMKHNNYGDHFLIRPKYGCGEEWIHSSQIEINLAEYYS